MTIRLNTTPDYALPGVVDVEVVAEASGANFAQLWITDAPDGSDFAKKLAATESARVLVAEVDSGATVPMRLDKPGVYVFTGQEHTRGTESHGGTYEGDPEGYLVNTPVGGEQTSLTIAIGDRMTLDIGLPTVGRATLVVHVWADRVRPTSLALHKEKTPALVNPTTPAAAAAAANSTVQAAVAAFENASISAMTTGLTTLWAELINDIPLHFNNDTDSWHANADDDNDTAIERLPTNPASPEGWARAVSTMAERLRLHFTNSNETTEVAGRYHVPADYNNLAIVQGVSPRGANMASVFAAIAGIYQAYSDHINDATIHATADGGTHTIAATLSAPVELNRAFLAALKPLQPTAADNQNAGTVRLSGLGFSLANN